MRRFPPERILRAATSLLVSITLGLGVEFSGHWSHANAQNADTLDGLDSTAFSRPGHHHAGESWTSATGFGLLIRTLVSDGVGIMGWVTPTSSVSFGVVGRSDSSAGTGVYGLHSSVAGTAAGVQGNTSSVEAGATGVLGVVTSSSPGFTSAGVRGINQSTTDRGAGVWGEHAGASAGVYGKSASDTGVYGVATATGSATTYGVRGKSSSNGYLSAGVFGESTSNDGYGVLGKGHTGGRFQTDRGLALVAYSTGSYGTGLMIMVKEGDLIVAYDEDPDELVFRVDDDGNVFAAGPYSGNGADFAEMLPATDGLEPGDLLAIGGEGKLVRSTKPYQTSVAGIYSTQPGFVGGADGKSDSAGKIPLAIVGIVPVKVVAERGAIGPGDLLAASSTPGHAMRAGEDPPNGTVVGKALGSLDRGTGTISMLVTLQ